MPLFKYVALDRNGKTRKGMLEAESERAAIARLRTEGVYPELVEQAVDDARQGKKGGAAAVFSLFRRVRADELSAFTAQLSTMLDAGLPLEHCLAGVLKGKLSLPLRSVLTTVRERLREGVSFSDALAEHPRVFNSTYVAMTSAGENSGALEVVMERLADHLATQLAVRRKIQAAIAYPVFMILFGLAVVFTLMIYIVPRVVEIFEDLGQALPLPTVVLIAMSDVLSRYWYVFPLLLVVLIFALRRYAATRRGRRLLDRLRLSLPFIGPITRSLCLARFARLFGMLLANGVEMMFALRIVREAVGNVVMAEAVDGMAETVKEGGNLSDPMSNSGEFPATAVQMIAAGEQSGKLDQMFTRVAKTAEEEADVRLSVLTSLAEPIMILLLGLVVGFVVLAIMLPILQMSSLVQ